MLAVGNPISHSRPVNENGTARRAYLVRAGLATPYSLVQPALARFADAHPAAPSRSVHLPSHLISANMHLDPDFEHLTYGDNGVRLVHSRVVSLSRRRFVGKLAGMPHGNDPDGSASSSSCFSDLSRPFR
jgi:hypothetical protein